jgi:hypothetical protein
MNPPIPDTAEAVRFLNILRPQGPWVLCSKRPDAGPFETKTFTTLADAERWIAARNGIANLYVTINPVIAPVSEKPDKSQIFGGEFLHVDLDPRQGEDIQEERHRILERLRNHAPIPSMITDSGSGYWGFWRLAETYITSGNPEKIAKFESYNRGLELALGGDRSCHNIDRVTRLVGSVNLPDANKRKKKRTAALAKIIWVSP